MNFTNIKVDKEIIDYLKKEKLDKYFNAEELNNIYNNYKYDPYFEIEPHNTPFPPDIIDLVRLHKLIRERKVFTILEFGLGYSTMICADALIKNELDFKKSQYNLKNNIRYPIFNIYSIDSSKEWIYKFQNKIKTHFKELNKFIKIKYSEVEIGEYNSNICHFYKNIPNIVPDFIYLDGPSPLDVKGNIKNLNFNKGRSVMSGDILKLESTLKPGTFILVDGRANNVRFLKNNFRRNFKYYSGCETHLSDKKNIDFIEWNKYDYSTFELVEFPLNYFNYCKLKYCLNPSNFKKYLNS